MSSKEAFSPMYAAREPEKFSAWEPRMDSEKPLEEPAVDLKAQQEAEREAAREAAREEGYTKGLEEGREAARQYEQKLQTILNQLANPLQQLDKRVDKEVLMTIDALCRNCIGIELSLNPDKMMAVWETIKSKLPAGDEGVQLRLSQADNDWLQEHIKDELQGRIAQAKVDENLGSGDFKIDFAHGNVDGRIATRIKNLVQAEMGNIDFS